MSSKIADNSIEVEKDLTNQIGPISQYGHVKLEMRFHFYNHLWNNNTAYIIINDHIYWLDHHNWNENGCNNERWNSSIRIVHKIVNNELRVKFGIKLNDGFRNLMGELTSCKQLIDILDKNMTIQFDNLNIFIK
jgi:hypothetical protein